RRLDAFARALLFGPVRAKLRLHRLALELLDYGPGIPRVLGIRCWSIPARLGRARREGDRSPGGSDAGLQLRRHVGRLPVRVLLLGKASRRMDLSLRRGREPPSPR